jgi:hypothetical protein
MSGTMLCEEMKFAGEGGSKVDASVWERGNRLANSAPSEYSIDKDVKVPTMTPKEETNRSR